MKRMLLAMQFCCAIGIAAAQAQVKTFCNPINIDYGVREIKGTWARHGADPAHVLGELVLEESEQQVRLRLRIRLVRAAPFRALPLDVGQAIGGRHLLGELQQAGGVPRRPEPAE